MIRSKYRCKCKYKFNYKLGLITYGQCAYKLRLISSMLMVVINLHAQYDHQSVFRDLEDEILEDALVSTYAPSAVYTLSQVRDTLYSRIYSENDTVTCVYSGLKKYLNPSLDPSEAIFGSGGNTDMNLEHCWPKSKGADFGLPAADMHHLFPTRVPVNSARGSDPFMELNDSETSAWYFEDKTQSNTPNQSVRDLYSEDTNFGFEPREDFKGNVARAYFYFYTMYRSEAEREDPDFFPSQVNDLCDWHTMDPVDRLEWERTFRIAGHQEGKPNPFVLDCSLARLYCDEISSDCRTVHTNEARNTDLRYFPNPVSSGESIEFSSYQSSISTYRILNIHGQIIEEGNLSFTDRLIAPLEAGLYIINLLDGQQTQISFKLFVK